MIEYVWKKDIEDILDFISIYKTETDELDYVKGLTFDTGDIWINLSAVQWLEVYELAGEEGIEIYLTQTVTHENIHNIFIKNEEHKDGEEIVCQIMSGQIESFPNRNI